MNRKLLEIFVVFMLVAMLATPIVGTVMAKKTQTVFTRTPGVAPPTEVILETETIPGVIIKLTNNMQVSSGTFRTVAYGSDEDNRGPLGYGKKYIETIISVQHTSGEILTTPMGETSMYGYGFGIYKIKFVIEGGPFGAGTLEATERFEWEWDLSDPSPRNWRYEGWSSYSLKQGTGDFEGVRVDLETYYNVFLGWYHTKTTVIAS